MISGLNTSSISLALRTAQRAERTLARTTEQIATGKKISSVKDDGANYISAKTINAQAKAKESLVTNYESLISTFEINAAAIESRIEGLEIARQNALAASDPSLSAEARANYQAMHDIYNGANPTASIAAVSHGQKGDTGAAFTFNNLQTVNILTILTGENGSGQTFQGALQPSGLPSASDLSTAATSAGAVFNFDSQIAFQRGRLNYWSSVGNMIEKEKENQSRSIDRLNQIEASLTDADMGKVSRENELAQTRQALAYQTVRNAINQYGAVSSSLLNNVMGTQRSVRA